MINYLFWGVSRGWRLKTAAANSKDVEVQTSGQGRLATNWSDGFISEWAKSVNYPFLRKVTKMSIKYAEVALHVKDPLKYAFIFFKI